MSELRLSVEERRASLMSARKDVERSIYALAAQLGVDIEAVDDLTLIGSLWVDPELEIPTIDADDPEWPVYRRLVLLADRLELIVSKLEGPNRIV